MDWAAFLSALLQLGFRLLEKVDAARAAEFRRRCADDPSGVLLAQLNPGSAESSGSSYAAKAGAERDAGSLDERQ